MRNQWSKILCLGIAATIAGLTGACSSAEPSPPLRIVTSNTTTLSGMEALHTGALAADSKGCIQAGTAGKPVTLVWPKGYSVRGDTDSFEILDSDKNVVATSGKPLKIGGGAADSVQGGWSGRDCAGSSLWMVGQIDAA